MTPLVSQKHLPTSCHFPRLPCSLLLLHPHLSLAAQHAQSPRAPHQQSQPHSTPATPASHPISESRRITMSIVSRSRASCRQGSAWCALASGVPHLLSLFLRVESKQMMMLLMLMMIVVVYERHDSYTYTFHTYALIHNIYSSLASLCFCTLSHIHFVLHITLSLGLIGMPKKCTCCFLFVRKRCICYM